MPKPTRRQFLKAGLASGASVVLAGCGQADVPATADSQPVATTQMTATAASVTATPLPTNRPIPLYQDHSQPLPARVADLIGRMTTDEKIAQLESSAPAIERLGVPQYNWWNEALHGIGRAGLATVFPQAIGLASSWNTDLMQQVASAIADEGRAKHHEAVREQNFGEYFGLTFWSPNINIFRDPRWGRGQETYGEDPFLTGEMGLHFVRGLQGDDASYLKSVAAPKHFAAHSGPEAERHSFDAIVSAHDLHMTYLPAFKRCIVAGKAQAIMGAYNRTNGEPCCASPTLLQAILRDRWGFSGFVVSDCGALYDIHKNHKVVMDEQAAAALALRAGCDLDCCGTYDIPCTYHALRAALIAGEISEAEIDQAVERLFTARFKLGMFDPPSVVPWAQIGMDVVDSAENRALALTAAEQSLVLLKNDGLLPLDPTKSQRIALIGPNADETLVLSANYFGTAADPISVRRGLEAGAHSAEIMYAQGCAITGDNREQFAQAVAAAQSADVAVMVMGLSQQLEGEQGQTEGNPEGVFSIGDRESLDLPAVQQALLEAIHATGTPIVLVLFNGSALAINWAADNVSAILEAWYPGQAGGTAIANALFGYSNPAGRLPITIYRSLADLPPFADYSMANRTYRYFSGDPLYRFGFGLSYTRFSYEQLQLSAPTLSAQGSLSISVTVRNSGSRSGDEVVQLYVRDDVSDLPAPQLQLQGFARITLAPNSAETVTFTLLPEQLALVDSAGEWVIEPGRFTVWVGGQQPDLSATTSDGSLSASFDFV